MFRKPNRNVKYSMLTAIAQTIELIKIIIRTIIISIIIIIEIISNNGEATIETSPKELVYLPQLNRG